MSVIDPTWPVLGLCGTSGAGKTTLIEALIPQLTAQGLAVAVVKHDAHGLQVDTPGKDSDRFFRAGATVLARGPEQSFLRLAAPQAPTLAAAVALLLRHHDLVLVEGHKDTPLPVKFWLDNSDGAGPPAGIAVSGRLPRDDRRLSTLLATIADWLPAQLHAQSLRAGILIGGRSSRMGTPKHLLPAADGRSWLEGLQETLLPFVDDVAILGRGELPPALARALRLADAPGRQGPAAGILAALRWDPAADWLIVACDMPGVAPAALRWLLDQRRPGVWGVLPRHPRTDMIEPLLGWYSHRLGPVLEGCESPRELADHPRVATPAIPPELLPCWRNINTPKELTEA